MKNQVMGGASNESKGISYSISLLGDASYLTGGAISVQVFTSFRSP